ncbi:MAG: hypothetical protein Q4A07_09915 [Coriobacteriales bacterium]|nr:hypothetical protein [Coriobacteriales bacterium]
MERRTFVKGAFGLVALATLGVAGVVAGAGTADAGFVTPEVKDAGSARGPVMAAGIRLAKDGDVVRGTYGDTHLFNVDVTGAELMRLADGSLTIDELADAASVPLEPATVASFFVELGQAGYLANTVLVNLTETQA